MSFVVSISGNFFVAAASGFVLPFMATFLFQRDSWRVTGPLLFALALVGACAGFAGGIGEMLLS